jgi:hypothetical protein
MSDPIPTTQAIDPLALTAGQEITLDDFGAVLRRGPWPRLIALSTATADSMRPDPTVQRMPWDQPTTFGVPVKIVESVPEGMVRIVEPCPEAVAARLARTAVSLASRPRHDPLIRITGL